MTKYHSGEREHWEMSHRTSGGEQLLRRHGAHVHCHQVLHSESIVKPRVINRHESTAICLRRFSIKQYA